VFKKNAIDKVTIDENGDVRVYGNLTVNGTQTIMNTDVGTTERLVITNDGTGPALEVNQIGNAPVVDFKDDGVTALTIVNGGNVGIGTANPQAKLHVNGTIQFSTFSSDYVFTNTTAQTYASGTYYNIGAISAGPNNGSGNATYIVNILARFDGTFYNNTCGSGMLCVTWWKANPVDGIQATIPMETHNSQNLTIYLKSIAGGQGNRSIEFSPSISFTIVSGGKVEATFKRIL